MGLHAVFFRGVLFLGFYAFLFSHCERVSCLRNVFLLPPPLFGAIVKFLEIDGYSPDLRHGENSRSALPEGRN